MSFFSSTDKDQKRKLALLHAVLLIFKSDSNPSMSIKLEQDSFIKTLSMGLSTNPLFTTKAEIMPDIEMASILRNCSNFAKRSYAQTLSSALCTTSCSQEVKETFMRITRECDIPTNFLRTIF